MTVTDQQRAEWRAEDVIEYALDPHLARRRIIALLDALADAWQEGYEEGSASNPYAGDDEPSPNPYLAGPSPTDEGGES